MRRKKAEWEGIKENLVKVIEKEWCLQPFCHGFGPHFESVLILATSGAQINN
jgi:hypothetical protein